MADSTYTRWVLSFFLHLFSIIRGGKVWAKPVAFTYFVKWLSEAEAQLFPPTFWLQTLVLIHFLLVWDIVCFLLRRSCTLSQQQQHSCPFHHLHVNTCLYSLGAKVRFYVMAKPCYSKSVTFFVDLPNQCQEHAQHKEKCKNNPSSTVLQNSTCGYFSQSGARVERV